MEEYRKYILASASPRRKELLGVLGIPFAVIPSDAEEDMQESIPWRLVERLSLMKAEEVFHRVTDPDSDEYAGGSDIIVIGADTVVACGGRILGKPHSRDEALEMLQFIAGRKHDVYTGVSILWGLNSRLTFHTGTEVDVYPLSQKEMEEYADSGEPYDKAGGYGIQGRFMKFVRGISGDYNNVVGLPVAELYQKMKEAGLL